MGGYRSSDCARRFFFRRRGALIDLIPFGPEIAAPHGKIVWPASNHEMTVVGFPEAVELDSEFSLTWNLRLRCVSPPGIVLLKIVSFLDRRRSQKGPNDAADILYWLKHHESGKRDTRRYGVLELGLTGVTYETAGAALLGAEVGKMACGVAHQCVEEFLREAASPYSEFVNASASRLIDPDREGVERERIVGLVSAFAAGYAAPRQISVLGWHTSSVQSAVPTFEVTYDLRPPAPTNRLTTTLTLSGGHVQAWQKIIDWARIQTRSTREYRIGLEMAPVEGSIDYFGRAAVGAGVGAPGSALEVGLSFRFGSTELASQRRKWDADGIPPEILWWIGQIDSQAWKAMHQDIARRSKG